MSKEMAMTTTPDSAQREALLPCPFCGCTDIATEETICDSSVWCRHCGAKHVRQNLPKDHGMPVAIGNWQRRALSPVANLGLVEALRKQNADLWAALDSWNDQGWLKRLYDAAYELSGNIGAASLARNPLGIKLRRDIADALTESAGILANSEERCRKYLADKQRDNALTSVAPKVDGELAAQIRKLGALIPCHTGGTFENDPLDAIIGAAISIASKLPKPPTTGGQDE